MPLLPLIARLAQSGPPSGFNVNDIPDSAHGGPPPEILSSIKAAAAKAAASATSSASSSSATTPAAVAAAISSSVLSAMPSGITGGPPSGFAIPSGGIPSGLPSGGTFDVLKHGGPSQRITNEMGNTLIGVTTMLLVLCLIAVGGRLISRRMVKQPFGSDDYWSIGSLLLFIGLAVSEYNIAYFNANEMAKLRGPPTPAQFGTLGKLKLTSTLLYFFILTAARISLLFLYKRVFTLRITWFKIAWWANMVLVCANGFVWVVVNLSQCSPHLISNLWEHPGLCHETVLGPAFSGFMNVAIDLTLLVLPVRMVWTLQMGRKQKWAISGVFALGLIGVAISIARAVTVVSPAIFESGIFLFAIWSTVEPAVTLICACLPVMRPLFVSIAKIIPSSGSWWSTYLPSRSRGSSSGGGKGSRGFRVKRSKDSTKSSSSDEKTLTNNSSVSGHVGSGAKKGSSISSPKAGFAGKFGKFGLHSPNPSQDSWGSPDPEKGAFGPVKVETRITSQELRSPPPPPSPSPPDYPASTSSSTTPPPAVPSKDGASAGGDDYFRHPSAATSPVSPKARNYHVGNYSRVTRDEGLDRQYRSEGSVSGGKKEGKWGLWTRREESKERMGQKAGICTRCHGDLRQGWE